jgi:hypothetical protein
MGVPPGIAFLVGHPVDSTARADVTAPDVTAATVPVTVFVPSQRARAHDRLGR